MADQPVEKPRRRLKLVKASSVQPRDVEWQWKPYLPLGKLSLLEGWQDEGKSFVTVDWAARISRGRLWPDDGSCQPRNVLMLSTEDPADDTIVPRLILQGANLDRVYVEHVDLDKDTGYLVLDNAGFSDLDHDLGFHNIGAVFIDPLFGFVDTSVDTLKATEVRALLNRLAYLAKKHHAAIVGLRHFRKAGGHSKVAGSGILDWGATVRNVLSVVADPEDAEQRYLFQTKLNIAKKGPAQGYRIDDPGPVLRWTGPTSRTFDEVMGNGSGGDSGRPAKQITKARDLIEEIFDAYADEDGWVEARRFFGAADAQGISKSTLNRAATELKPYLEKEQRETGWWWKWSP